MHTPCRIWVTSTIQVPRGGHSRGSDVGHVPLKTYYEIYLKSTRVERIKRDKKKLYLPALNGEKKNVVDVDIPFEEPKSCDLEVETENKNLNVIVEEILEKIKI